MTCREKFKLEHPKLVNDEWDGGCYGCPHHYGYLDTPESCLAISCGDCWDREIPMNFDKRTNAITVLTSLSERLQHVDDSYDKQTDLEAIDTAIECIKACINIEKYIEEMKKDERN